MYITVLRETTISPTWFWCCT